MKRGFWRLWLLACLCSLATAAPLPLPRVDAEIDPAKSFWDEHVHYPFAHQYATVPDGQGRAWEVAYADLYHGDPAAKAKAPVLVLLHGRGMNSGYWGLLMQTPLDAGWRVIAIDWSFGGKSLPKNLERPLNRSLAESRKLVFNLVVKQLGIAKASYLGHSLGGQLAAGYAIAYPQHVERLVLYAPGGLESFPPIYRQGVRLDDPALARGSDAFLAEWEKSGILPGMGRTAAAIEKGFYEPPRPGSLAYVKRGDALNEFMVASRAGILRGNPRERARMLQGYGWESLAALHECRRENDDAFPGRLAKLKVPTLLALGLKDPIYPVPGSGNTHVLKDTVHTVFLLVGGKNSPVKIRLYPEGGHFLHTDLPGQFDREVLDFITTGKVAEPVYAGDPTSFLAPPRATLAELPPEVRDFAARYQQAFKQQDLAAVRALFHPDYQKNGERIEQRMKTYESFISAITRWNLRVFSLRRSGDLIVFEGETDTDFGLFPDTFYLKEWQGQWRSFGNQQ